MDNSDTSVASNSASKQLKKKPQQTNNEAVKLQLAKLMSQEVLLWDVQHELHCDSKARHAAWKRISVGLDLSATKCKVLWKSLRDGHRYRMKTNEDVDADDDWPFKEALTFLNPRKTDEAEVDTTNVTASPEKLKPDQKPVDDSPQTAKMSAIHNGKIVVPLAEYAKALTHMAKVTKESTVKYNMLYAFMENVYESIEQDPVQEINHKLINMVYDTAKQYEHIPYIPDEDKVGK